MKILILTCNTGQGHNSSAAAIKEAFEGRGVECEIRDAFGFVSRLGSKMLEKCFIGVYRNMPGLWDDMYTKADKKPGIVKLSYSLGRRVLPGSWRLRRYIEKNGFSHVIAVHILPAVMISEMKKRRPLGVTTSFLSTDYTYYPFTEKTDMDAYFLPHKGLSELFLKQGVTEDKLIATGIPVRRAFLQTKKEKSSARAALGLPEHSRVVLIMGGSMGCGPIEELVKKIAGHSGEDLRLLVSCGTNDKLLNALRKMDDERILPFRYSDSIPEMMSAADLFVTKPGGISITEAGVMGLPMLLINMVGGCETPNYEFFVSRGFAFGANDVDDAAKLCAELFSDSERLRLHSERVRSEFYRNSADEISLAVANIGEKKPVTN